MSEPLAAAEPAPPDGAYGRLLRTTCRAYAMAGAMVFVAIVVMSVVSITGRKLMSRPVPGDVEVLQMCAAFAAASFFAWCHLAGGDVKVDFFTARLPARAVHGLDAIGSLLVALFGALIAWRSAAGALVVREAGERSMILDWPLWLPQAAMVPGFALLALAGLYRARQHVAALRKGRLA
jgi:TRAP-type C4-dicarboxylate transport system permease small subunit